jgi:hypothetical protein
MSDLVLTIRVHDPDEKKDHKMSACWVRINLDRANIGTSAEKLAEQLVPHLKEIKNLRLA